MAAGIKEKHSDHSIFSVKWDSLKRQQTVCSATNENDLGILELLSQFDPSNCGTCSLLIPMVEYILVIRPLLKAQVYSCQETTSQIVTLLQNVLVGPG